MHLGSDEPEKPTEKPPKPEEKPDWEELDEKEIQKIVKIKFLEIVFNLTNIFNATIKPTTEEMAKLIKQVVKTDKELRDLLVQKIARKRTKEEMYADLEDDDEDEYEYEDDEDEDDLFFELKDSQSGTDPQNGTDPPAGVESFSASLMKVNSFIKVLEEENPKMEFLTINLKTMEATFKANDIPVKPEPGELHGNKNGTSTYFVFLYCLHFKLVLS